jgi:hypothetical protein
MSESSSKGGVTPQGRQQADKAREKSREESQERSKDQEASRSSQEQKKSSLEGTSHRGATVPTGPGSVVTTTETVRQEEPSAKATPAVKAPRGEQETVAGAFHRGLRRESSVAMDPVSPTTQVVEHSRRIDRTTGVVVAVDQEPLQTSEVVSKLREAASQPQKDA